MIDKSQSFRLPLQLLALMAASMAGYSAAGYSESVSQSTDILVDTAHPLGPIDLTRYALGQGGLSAQPMIADRIEQIEQLHPQTIHIFLQEYFNIYPAHHQYHWESLDKTLEAVRATGATPVVSLVFKPKVLFPRIDQNLVAPTSWPEWEDVIYHLVKHVNEDRKFGVKCWILSNEGDLGEPGGVPFKFPTIESYLDYYKHTASAIRRADPNAKIGGPSPANSHSDQVDALVAAAGEGKVPLDVLSFHGYSNDPETFRHMIETIQAKLARYPSLSHVQTFIDQWNFNWNSPSPPNQDSYFQPAFVMETTKVFYETGLSGAAFFHIRDYFVNEKEFTPFMSPGGAANMARWWDEMPQYEGIYDNQDRVKPDYFAFKLLSLIRGEKLSVTGTGPEIHAFAARGGHWVNLILWNYPQAEKGTSYDVTVRFPEEKGGWARVVRLNAAAPSDNLEQIRYVSVSTLTAYPIQLTLHPYEICWVEITE
jgi:xylan 1,4-beta-xylosidase